MLGIRAAEGALIGRIGEAQIIPATPGPLRHGVGLAGGTVGAADPGGRAGERRFAGGGGFEIGQFGRQHREGGFREGLVPGRLPNDGERLAPITLAAEEPVAQFIVDCSMA